MQRWARWVKCSFYDLNFMGNLVEPFSFPQWQKRPNSSVKYWRILCECRKKLKQFISCGGNVFCERHKNWDFWKIFSQLWVNNFDTLLINGQLRIYEGIARLFCVHISSVLMAGSHSKLFCFVWWSFSIPLASGEHEFLIKHDRYCFFNYDPSK